MNCNVYSYDLPSVGDRNCAPMQYFDFPKIKRNTFVDPKRYAFFIWGGGGHIHIPSPDYNGGRFGHLEAVLPYAHRIILWGVGHNVHGTREIVYPDYMDKFLLTGFRDVQRQDWVACPSCMHTAFDKKYPIEDEYRAFTKKGMPIDCPKSIEDNGTLTVDEVAEFLGGAKTVLTNSYHGAYWALLLGRKVIIRNPYSSKFYGILEYFREIDGDIYLTPPNKYLDKCRNSNRSFYKKVIAMLG